MSAVGRTGSRSPTPRTSPVAKTLRAAYAVERAARDRVRAHPDGQRVQLRALPDYDALYGVDPTWAGEPVRDL